MGPDEYELGKPVTAEAWGEEGAGEDAVLYVEGMSRSGPWYHLAGIAGGDYQALKSGKRYKAEFYEVYPRSYSHMKSAYIFLWRWER